MSIVAYSQISFPLTKGIAGFKNITFAPPVLKSYYLSQENKTGNATEIQSSIPCLKPDLSTIMLIPTLKLFQNCSPIPNSIKLDK
jgi:hypothetical protein